MYKILSKLQNIVFRGTRSIVPIPLQFFSFILSFSLECLIGKTCPTINEIHGGNFMGNCGVIE